MQARPMDASVDDTAGKSQPHFLDAWQAEADLKTYRQAVADVIAFRISQGETFEMMPRSGWPSPSVRRGTPRAEKARSMDIDVAWDCELAKTPRAITRCRAAWNTPSQVSGGRAIRRHPVDGNRHREPGGSKEFAEAIHAEFPDKMLAYNLSPSFNWDTTGMSESR